MNVWDRAKQIIPGGNQLVSKRPDRFCPGSWPSHYTWAHGNKVTSAEGITYYDYSTMGIGTCILGYGDPDVDASVIQAIAAGNMSSLNPIEELELAEEMLKLNPKMEMVKFARTGGEACMIAARIASMANKKRGRKPEPEFYLQHGYSGWALGNPEKSYGMSLSGIEMLDLIDGITDQISFIIMEPVRNYPDKSIALMKETRKFATEHNIPLIFDEITSGFRVNIGGYHATKQIYPDIVVYGKALGNGYPISAVLGIQEIMDNAEETFISSTFWSERSGYAAALATIEKMKKAKVPATLISMGTQIQEGWKDTADIYGLDIEVTGIPPLAHFAFKEDNDKLMTFFTQEMLRKGILASDQFYTSVAHGKSDIDNYLYQVDQIFSLISEGKVTLDGPVRTTGWKRVN